MRRPDDILSEIRRIRGERLTNADSQSWRLMAQEERLARELIELIDGGSYLPAQWVTKPTVKKGHRA